MRCSGFFFVWGLISERISLKISVTTLIEKITRTWRIMFRLGFSGRRGKRCLRACVSIQRLQTAVGRYLSHRAHTDSVLCPRAEAGQSQLCVGCDLVLGGGITSRVAILATGYKHLDTKIDLESYKFTCNDFLKQNIPSQSR